MKTNEKKYSEILERVWSDIKAKPKGSLSAHDANFLMLEEISSQLRAQSELLQKLVGQPAKKRKKSKVFGWLTE